MNCEVGEGEGTIGWPIKAKVCHLAKGMLILASTRTLPHPRDKVDEGRAGSQAMGP